MNALLQLFRTSAGKFRAELADVREKLEAARRRREDLLTLPLPAGDFKDFLGSVLDRRAAAYEENLARRIGFFVVNAPKKSAEHPSFASASLVADGSGMLSCGYVEQCFAYFFKDQVLAGLVALAAKTGTKPGPSRAEREAQLPKLETEIAALEAREAEMVKELESIRQEAKT